MATDEILRREVDELGRLFGETIRRYSGEAAFNHVEAVRLAARRFNEGQPGAAEEMDRLLGALTEVELRVVVEAFSTFLELANIAEDRQRVRALRATEQDESAPPRRESVAAAIASMRSLGVESKQLEEILAAVEVELVFTAHPTEAKRKSVRAKLREIRRLLAALDNPTPLPRERQELRQALKFEIAKLWQTDFVRPNRPTVLEEVARGLSFQPVLRRTAPTVLSEVRAAVKQHFPDVEPQLAHMLSFGSWMGGDRDGHPHVTPEITAETFRWLRRSAIEAQLNRVSQMLNSLSMSARHAPELDTLSTAIDAAAARWPECSERITPIPLPETPRRWLKIIEWRLEQSAKVQLSQPSPAGAYPTSGELTADVARLHAALVAAGDAELAETELQPWLDEIAVFGLHTTRLDIRQHSDVYRQVMVEILAAAGLVDQDGELSERQRQQLLIETLPIAANLAPVNLSPIAAQTLELFAVIRRVARAYGMEAIGAHVVSMTHAPSDILTVLWLWRWSARVDGGDPGDAQRNLPLAPLFETISDLEHGAEILNTLLSIGAYREHLRAVGDRQLVMIGYSDSTKDGGYLAACWGLQQAQMALHGAAAEHGVRVTFFHGRGGSLGRGGGPAARGILSLPPETFDGPLRLTEQGEVLAERYDDPAIAHRHLEQVLWAVLMAVTHPMKETPAGWCDRMRTLAADSYGAYRQLVDHPHFTTFFRLATPIGEIEGLPIGSRPAKRKSSDRIEDLRAIPWVFSWTQCRCLLPAWYGLGASLGSYMDTTAKTEELAKLYHEWPFFRATIDNAALALAKSNMPVFHRYLAAAGDAPGVAEIGELLATEFERSCEAVRKILGCAELLDDVPWLKRSIQVRNGYVDPLNLIQVEVHRRRLRAVGDDDSPEFVELKHLTQLTIKGVAAGMRTTG